MCCKTALFSKLFLLILAVDFFVSVVVFYYFYHVTIKPTYRVYRNELPCLPERPKFILVWTTVNGTEHFGEGGFPFIDNRCSNTNCYLTTNKTLLDDYTDFDAIVFNSEYMRDWRKKNLPSRRSAKQKYIFYSALSPDDAPVCNVVADDYFNWTCTYKLDSDIVNPMIEVLDLEGKYVAPKDAVDWKLPGIELSLDREIYALYNKTKAMAWVVDRCVSSSDRLTFARKLREALKEISLDFDIYGCGFLECPEGNCTKVLRDYYFYFAAEDSDSADYITKEVLRAYHTLAVPVVKGGADYTKFLPEGSYIDAGTTTIDRLVTRIDYAIRFPHIYNHFHLWRWSYRIRAVNPFQGLCKICKDLHHEKFNMQSIKRDFRQWWNKAPLSEHCLPKSAESLSYVLSYANKSIW